MNLNQVTIPVTNVARSIEYYQKLGLNLIVHTHSRYARFECPVGDATLSLHQVESVADGSGAIVYFECEDLDERVVKLRERGIEFDQLPIDQSWLWREAHLTDPDKNRLILFFAGANRKNPPWRKSDEG